MATKLKQVRIYGIREGDAERVFEIMLEVDGRRRRFQERTLSFQQAVEDAYFFHTGRKVQWVGDRATSPEPIFTAELADANDFTHLEGVPNWSTAPE